MTMKSNASNNIKKESNSVKLPEEIHTTPGGQQPADLKNNAKDIIPDEVPRKDGPGGEGK